LKILEFFLAALDTLWANRMRSSLTMIGIVIGTAAVISIFAIGQSASSSIGGLLSMTGDRGTIIFPNNATTQVSAPFSWSDVKIIRDACTRCDKVFPSYNAVFFITINHKPSPVRLVSRTDYIKDSFAMSDGRRFDEADVAGARAVCLLTYPTAKKLFPNGPAVGRDVRLADRRFTVIGVFADISLGLLGAQQGDVVFIPYTTYHQVAGSQIAVMQVYPKPGVTSTQVTDEVEKLLQRTHGVRAKYTGIDSSQQASAFLSIIGFVSVAISGIGGIALVVGGIGVMNMMLVSVNERTREIGIRKAIGASRRDILLQFLTEAAAITLLGGIIGTILGGLAGAGASSLLITQLSGSAGHVAWVPIIAVSLGFSILVGIFFGTYPAVRASRLSPIDCLRHE
jgi:ABC-type antimicrobial peptide transport system permease subunit